MLFLRKLSLVLIIAALLGAGGYYTYSQYYLPAQAAPEPELQTARVRTGDLVITAAGAGNLVPAAEVDLGFRTSGMLVELNAAVGDIVQAGQVLARLDDTAARLQLEQAQINLDALTSPYAVAEAEKALADALITLGETEYARLSQQEGYRGSTSDVDTIKAALLLAEEKVQKAWDKYEPLSGRPENDLQRAAALAAYSAAVESRDAVLVQLNWYLGAPGELDQASLNADVAIAQTQVAAAQVLLAELKGEPATQSKDLPINPSLTQLRQARLTLQNAQNTLENTVLTAPIAGTVTAVNSAVGEAVNTNPILTIAALDQPLVRFYVEESDLGKVAPGYPMTVVFDSAPELTFQARVLRVDPVLATIDGSPAVQAWGKLEDSQQPFTFVSGMTAEVEVIAGKAENALLVPAQALRELAPGSYAVFVVQADGQLKLTTVTIGLRDFANVEILSGLKLGDVVSTGNVETQ